MALPSAAIKRFGDNAKFNQTIESVTRRGELFGTIIFLQMFYRAARSRVTITANMGEIL